MLSLKFLISILFFILKFSFSSENKIAMNEICVDMKEISNFTSTNSILIKTKSEYLEINQINSTKFYGQCLIYPNKNIFQNCILPFLNTNDLIKILRVFQCKKINVTNFFPKTFHVKQITSMNNENAKFLIFPDSPNLDTILFFQNQNKLFFLSTESTSPVDVNENLDYVLLQNEIKNFKFQYLRYNKEKKKLFSIMLAISENQFVLALKKIDKIKIIWHANFTKISVQRPEGTDEKLSLDAFDVCFPQDIDIILKSRKYSKKHAFKILHRYLNFLDRYYRCVIPNLNKKPENCFDWALEFVFCIAFICGYGLIIALPLFLETNLIFLPLLWKNPKFIFYTSFFSALAWMNHAIHHESKNMNEYWLVPHLKAWKSDRMSTIAHIFFMWGVINAFIALYSVFYFEPYFNYSFVE